MTKYANLLNTHGYVILNNVIPQDDLNSTRRIALSLKEDIINKGLLGTTKKYGSPVYNRALDMSSAFSSELMKMYTSGWMIPIAKELLQQDHIYAFNDQVVVKLPNEDFLFPEHTDNFFGPDPEAALRKEFRTITCSWVLDDFSEDNGPVSILDQLTNEWVTPLAKAGDMMVWDGNTPHKSSLNLTDKPRCVWLLIYSTHDIANRENLNPSSFVSAVDFSKFHSSLL